MMSINHPDILLEQECQSTDYKTFCDNILNRKNMICNYYQHYLINTKMYNIVRWQQLPDNLIHVLKLNNEDFDEKGHKRKHLCTYYANNKSTNRPISLIESHELRKM